MRNKFGWDREILNGFPFYYVNDRNDLYIDKEDHVIYKFDVPGFSKDDLEIIQNGKTLEIFGEIEDDFGKKTFNRKFTVDINSISSIDAKVKNGELYLTLNKKKEVQPLKISVS